MKFNVNGWNCDMCNSRHGKDDVCYYDSNQIAITYVSQVGIKSDTVYEDVCRECLSKIQECINEIKSVSRFA